MTLRTFTSPLCRIRITWKKIYESTDEAGFRVVTWYNAGTRNFYGKKPINTPDDLKGMKIRVQQSPASVAMVNAFGAAAAPRALVKFIQRSSRALLMVLRTMSWH